MMTMRLAAIALCAATGCGRLFGLHDVPVVDLDAAPDAPPPGQWASGAGGAAHTCAIRADDHALYCWGRNELGQLGLGADAGPEVDRPTLVAPGPWSEVVAANNSTCARRDDDTVWCFGDNANSQLGTGAMSVNNVELAPIEISGKYTTVRLGAVLGCGLDTDGAVWCWGNSGAFLGMTPPLRGPMEIAVGPYTAIAVGANTACALAGDGTLACWGANDFGEAGQPGGGTLLTAAIVPGTWSAIYAAGWYTCAIAKADASLQCWGYNASGQLGDMTVNGRFVAMPVQGAGAAWQSAELADDHACGHTTDGKTWCWGSNVYGELADPALDALRMRTYATQVAGDFEGGFTGLGHECFIARDTHTMSCVGRGGGGQLGDGTAGSRRLPVHVADDLANVSAGSYATCAVSSAGALTCWGSDHEGILGDGQVTPIDLQTPTTIAPAITWQQVSLADHACGLDDTQTIYCWGSNANGQLGDGTLLERHAPTPLSVPTGWTAVTSGINHSCGLGTDGGLWCWGLNTAGECGQPWATLGGTDVVLAATRVGTGQWSTAAAGSAFTCAVDGSAQLQCFGYDALGALGDTMSASRYLPAPTVPPISGKVVTAGANVGCGIDMTGKLACWGYDPEGEIGDGTTTSHGGPTAVVVPPTWHSVSTGFQHTCGITTDNALYCWGKNYYGETGSGDFEEHHDPHQVGTDTDWAAVTTGYTHTCALKTDHSLWCWGDDRDGELGDGAAWRSTLGVVP